MEGDALKLALEFDLHRLYYNKNRNEHKSRYTK